MVGGGIFGISTALEISKNFDVTLYERSKELLSGASTNNHLRHHQGYHYNVIIGALIDGTTSTSSNIFNGLIDEVRVYYRSLSATEMFKSLTRRRWRRCGTGSD